MSRHLAKFIVGRSYFSRKLAVTFVSHRTDHSATAKENKCTTSEIEKLITNNSQVKKLVDDLIGYGITLENIKGALISEPLLAQYNLSNAVSIIDLLCLHGFRSDAALSIIASNPAILMHTREDISQRLEAWRSQHFSEAFIKHMFTDNPQAVLMDTNELSKRVPALTYYLDSKIGRVTRILVNCPDLLYQDWDQVVNKFNYLHIAMKVPDKQISDSRTLSRSYSYIKLRHTFLEKVGVYRVPDPKDKGFSACENPKLHLIMDTSDRVFAQNVAKVSLEEYEVYKDLQRYIPVEHERFIDDDPPSKSEYLSDQSDDELDEDYYDNIESAP